MATFAEFLATIGTKDGEFAPFDTGPLPLNIPGLIGPGPTRQMQHEVLNEILDQSIALMQDAQQKYPDEVWLTVWILARAEKLVTSYVEEDFDELVPMQKEMRRILQLRWRMERRRFIRIALMRPDLREQTIKGGWLKNKYWAKREDYAEDFRDAERCVNEGAWLGEGLGLTRRKG
jgi:hypothetical protein